MSSENLIRMAESCTVLRRSIGHVLLSADDAREREAAEVAYREALRRFLAQVREHECALLLEAAGELAE